MLKIPPHDDLASSSWTRLAATTIGCIALPRFSVCLGLIVTIVFSASIIWSQIHPARNASTEPTDSAQRLAKRAPQVQPILAPALQVMVGRSLLISTRERLKRVSTSDPAVADAVVVSPTQLLIFGRAPGEVTLVLWDEQERWRSFDLHVETDLAALNDALGNMFPNEKITASAARSAIILSGYVSSRAVAEHAGMITRAYSKNVINILTYALP